MSQINIMEYYDWVATQGFENSEEHHKSVSYQEQNFVQKVIYPMFYKNNTKQFTSSIPFPLILKDYSSWNPKYVIDKEYFRIIFFSYYDEWESEICWEVSIHVKDHDFCDKRVNEFKKWFKTHYCANPEKYFIRMEDMPKGYKYPKIELNSDKVDDFCIEFWNEHRDFMLFKLMDLLRIF